MSPQRHVFLILTTALMVTGPAAATDIPFSAGSSINAIAHDATSVIAADFDGDGMIDLAGSAAGADDAVYFWRNDGSPSGWPRQRVSEQVFQDAWYVQAGDIDGDGDLDIVGAARTATASSGFGARDLVWWENDGTPASGFWSAHTIDVAGDGARAVAIGDIDGDGDLDIAATNIDGADSEVAWYANNGTGGGWARTRCHPWGMFEHYGPYGVDLADIDGDGDLDIVTSGTTAGQLVWFENVSLAWAIHTFIPIYEGAGHVKAADMDHDGDIDVVAAAHGGDEISWFANNGPGYGWTQHTVTQVLDGALSVDVGDLDADGDLDIVAAADGADAVRWYENTSGNGGGWVARTVENGVGDARSVVIADLDGDGDLDVAAAAKGDDQVSWWANETIHRSPRFASTSAHQTDLNLGGTVATAVADVNGDGTLDVVAVSHNDSAAQPDIVVFLYDDVVGGFWTHEVISTVIDASGVAVGDVDGDGDIDLVVTRGSGSSGSINCYLNQGGILPNFVIDYVDVLCGGARSPAVADFDGDGDLDLAASCFGDGTVATWENNGSWTRRDIGGTANAVLTAGDVTGDGRQDLVVGRGGAVDDIVILAGNKAFNWTWTWVDTNANDVADLELADVDGDGKLDVVAALFVGDEVAWWEHPDGGWTAPWTWQIIEAVNGPTGVSAADLDTDGDVDIVVTATFASEGVWYFRNRLDEYPGWGGGVRFADSGDVSGPMSPAVADFDGDGFPDIVVGAVSDGDMPVYWNYGGQFYVATLAVGDDTIAAGESRAVLRLGFVHEGTFRDTAMEVASVQVRFTDAAGDPLTSAEANAIIASFALYRDDGDGQWDAGDDFICMDSALDLINGREDLYAADGDPDAMVPGDTFVNFWLVVTMTADADTQAVNAFRVTHLAVWNPATSAEDRDHDIPLRIETTGNGASQLLTITPESGDLIFTDGFESGDTTAWSGSVQ